MLVQPFLNCCKQIIGTKACIICQWLARKTERVFSKSSYFLCAMMVQCHVNSSRQYFSVRLSIIQMRCIYFEPLSPFLCSPLLPNRDFGLSIYDKSACIMRQVSICQIVIQQHNFPHEKSLCERRKKSHGKKICWIIFQGGKESISMNWISVELLRWHSYRM